MLKIKDLPKIERPREERVSVGHRKRLRERFLQSGLVGFLDYEVAELLLTLGTPRKDCKLIAKAVVQKFGGLQEALEASPQELRQIKGLGPHNIFGLKLFRALSERYAKDKLPRKVNLDSLKAVVSFLQEKIGKEKKEHFLILALDNRNNLIKYDEISVGTLNASIVHPREVFRAATQALAAYIILAHNHPSGDSSPSEKDNQIVEKIVQAGEVMGIPVVDFIIVSKNNHYSFREKLKKHKKGEDYIADGIQGTLFAKLEVEKPTYEITAEKIRENYFYIPQVKENHIQLHNRRYIGNKHKLIEWIFSVINKECSGNSFADIFAGTGVVSAVKNRLAELVRDVDAQYLDNLCYA